MRGWMLDRCTLALRTLIWAQFIALLNKYKQKKIHVWPRCCYYVEKPRLERHRININLVKCKFNIGKQTSSLLRVFGGQGRRGANSWPWCLVPQPPPPHPHPIPPHPRFPLFGSPMILHPMKMVMNMFLPIGKSLHSLIYVFMEKSKQIGFS